MFKPGDALVLAAVIIITLLWWQSGDTHGSAPASLRVVTSAGEDTLSLHSDTVFSRGSVTIEIISEEAAITLSDCPTQQCVRTGWIQSAGQMSACMPNGIFIQVLGSEENSPDAVTY